MSYKSLFPLLLLLGLLPQQVLANPAAKAEAKPPKPPLSVIAYQVVERSLPVQLSVLGRLLSNQSVNISANVNDVVTAIHFKDAQQVDKGQLLVEINASEQLALLEQAKASEAEAKRQYLRVKEIETSGNVTKSLVDERYRQWQTASAQTKVIAAQLEKRSIYAPFAGQVGLTDLTVGTLVQVGTKIVGLDDTRKMKLDLLLPNRYLADLKTGQALDIASAAYPDQRFRGEIVAISPRVETELGMIQARAMVENPMQNGQRPLKSGMLVQAGFRFPTQQQMMVPNTAILMLGDRQFVYRLIANEDAQQAGKAVTYQAERIEIETGRRGEKFTQVVSGLALNDLVVSQGVMMVSPKRAIKIKTLQTNQSQEALLSKPVKPPQSKPQKQQKNASQATAPQAFKQPSSTYATVSQLAMPSTHQVMGKEQTLKQLTPKPTAQFRALFSAKISQASLFLPVFEVNRARGQG